MSFRHIPLLSAPQLPPEEPRQISCWHGLTIILSVCTSSLASFLLVRSVLFYIHADHILEECTADWNAHFPCHYLLLWIKFHGPESVYDTKCFIIAFSIFVIAISTQFLVASVLLIIGISRGSHLALIPWLVLKWVVILILLCLLLADIGISSSYSETLTVTSGLVVFALFNWASAFVTYRHIRGHNSKLSAVNDLDYIHLTSLSSSVAE